MTDIVLAFEVHQPFRIRKDFFWNQNMFQHLSLDGLFDHYFDSKTNRDLFLRASEKCYLPTNKIIQDAIKKGDESGLPVKVAFSISGVFLEQCSRYGKRVLESFQELSKTGRVEFISQTYYHSLASLYPTKEEFDCQVHLHRQTIGDLFGQSPRLFENTEFLYNNRIASWVEELGFDGIFTEGAERFLGNRSPNHIYTAKDTKNLKLLLRNYKLTDDVAFRFSARWWNEWPLTADKYAMWLSDSPGDCITIFPDYETFGEHQWLETGILDFLQHLFPEIAKRQQIRLVAPSEAVSRNRSVGEVDVPEPATVSWADIERGAGSWLGNTMQWAYYVALKNQEQLISEAHELLLERLWRYFQTSDHLYYMFTSGGGPGEVHSYFDPFGSPTEAFVSCFSALVDFDSRLKENTIAANEAFRFYTGVGEEKFTGISVRSLKGFAHVLKHVHTRSLEFHNRRGDFEVWFRSGLCLNELADATKEITNLRGNELREALQKLTVRYTESRLCSQSQSQE